MSMPRPYPGALGFDASATQHALLQPTIGYQFTLKMPGNYARTIGVSNKSSLWVYVAGSSASPSPSGGYAKAVAPNFSSVFPIGATQFVTFLVSTAPDGTQGPAVANPVIDVTASPLPAVAVQDVFLAGSAGGGGGGIAADVTVVSPIPLPTVVGPLPLPTSTNQLPSAAPLADATANPSTTLIGADLEALNAAGTWDRLRSAGDNTDALATIAAGVLRVLAELRGFNGATWDRLRSWGDSSDPITTQLTGILRVLGEQYLYNGTAWERARTPNVFKWYGFVATVTPGSQQVVWTPAAGRRFRLMRYSVEFTNVESPSGVYPIDFYDGTTYIGISQVGAGIAGQNAYNTTGWVDLGNGVLSSTPNNSLIVIPSGSQAGTAGGVNIIAAGTEE